MNHKVTQVITLIEMMDDSDLQELELALIDSKDINIVSLLDALEAHSDATR